jgi:GH24 family phage-related lysozyme (muramidase)
MPQLCAAIGHGSKPGAKTASRLTWVLPQLIQEFEGCHLERLQVPGWGVDNRLWGTTRYGDGRQVQQGDKINRVVADMLLRQEVDRIAEKLRATVPFWVAMADHQRSRWFVRLQPRRWVLRHPGFETISKRLREKDWAGVPDALLLYRNPGTNVEAGLKRRRIAEGNYGASAADHRTESACSRLKRPSAASITPHITAGRVCAGSRGASFRSPISVRHSVAAGAVPRACARAVRWSPSGDHLRLQAASGQPLR